tara:strand:- start:696 stop:1526 length:831 start_codon:yes stop_codon:yes gene_type:complete
MISLDEIEEVLNEFDATERHQVKYSIRFFLPSMSQYIYINRQAGNEPSGLVLHPRYESAWRELLLLDGVQSTEALNHKSSYRQFPQRIHTGKDPIPFGIPFGFDTKTALRSFLRKLGGVSPLYVRDSEGEILDAEKKGEFKGLSSTDVERLVKSRKGQGKFRRDVIDLWKECSVTGCQQIQLLKASHIKPWRDASNEERLDSFNGLLLTPSLDTLFDGGFITFDKKGKIVVSSAVETETFSAFGIDTNYRLKYLNKKTENYLKYHRKYIFQNDPSC